MRRRSRAIRSGILLGVLIAVSVAAAALAAGRFTDDDGNTHEANIEAIAAEGITKGCNPPVNDLYCPSDPVTRGQMAAFIRRAFNLPGAVQDHFIDDDGTTFEGDINAVAAAGITKGCNPPSNNQYCPNDFVTRGQMAAFIRRAFDYPSVSVDFFDDDNGNTFEADINAIAAEGVTKGCNPPINDLYCPDDLVLRDQMASFLARALDLQPIPVPDPCKELDAAAIFVSTSGSDANDGSCDSPVRTIQRGVDIAPVGGQVVVDSGVYLEQVEVPKNLVLEALSPRAAIVDGLGGSTNFAVIEVQLGVTVEFDGFVVRNGPDEGLENRGVLTVKDSIIRANEGPGILNEETGSITILSSDLRDNKDFFTAFFNLGEASLTNVMIRDNLGLQAVDNSGTFEATGLTVASNQGQGIRNDGALTLRQSEVDHNSSELTGGGLFNWNGGTAELIDSAVVNNSASNGGGIYNDGAGFSGSTFFEAGTLILNRVLIAGNTAEVSGGGLFNAGAASLQNVTISDNTAEQQFGGGVYADGGCCFSSRGVVLLTNSTVSFNGASQGGGIHVEAGSTVSVAGTVEMKNSIISNSISGLDCVAVERDFQEDGILTTLGHNIDSDDSCGLDGTGDLANTDPLLGLLRDNGGFTQTHTLLSGSPAIDAADDTAAPSVDQRGISRPQGESSDMGAYERVQ